jgi:hypothetical protein
MKHASAMKYGGELFAAEDCSYDSFKELVPLCPNCKEPVFLRVGGARLSVKGTEYNVGPHWCHFKGISAEQVAGCESRVNSYTDKDKQRIASQARGQRIKLLQRWFWSVVKKSPAMEGLELQLDVLSATGASQLTDVLIKKAKADKYAYVQFIGKISYEDYYMLCLDGRESEYNTTSLITASSLARPNERTRKYMREVIAPEINNERAFRLHKKITQEAFLFLVSESNEDIKRTIFLGTAVLWLSMFKPPKDGELRITADNTKKMIQQVLMSLMTIPWASEFQRLEAESKQQRA